MSRERFQSETVPVASETGQTIDDNFFFGNTSPLFYTVNPRSGISLRQQEQLGAPSILKSFRDLPGCTRLSSSLSNLDNTGGSRRAQFPLLPDINHKGNMGKSLQGHHSSSKRFVRERYNPPFKVNAKIRHVYTQEVTTIEGQGQPTYHQASQKLVTCHRQTQTDTQLFPQSKQKPEVSEKIEEEKERPIDNNTASGQDVYCAPGEKNKTAGSCVKTVDASTSPIPSPYFPSSVTPTESSSNPFSGCSQMTVYPPLNYVRKLEDLEKITGHIVIQRFFTRTDDAFGTWLEKQLGMTSKSVSVDTSEFENAKTAELVDDDDQDDKQSKNAMNDEAAVVVEADDANANSTIENETFSETNQNGEIIAGAIANPGEGNLLTENSPQEGDENLKDTIPDCTLTDSVKCECYIDEIGNIKEGDRLKDIEEQIITPENALLTSTSTVAEGNDAERTTIADDEVETLMSSSAPTKESDNGKNVEDIDEVVRCTLEAYLMAPMAFEDVGDESGDQISNDQVGENDIKSSSPTSGVKSEVDSGRAESIQSQERMGMDGMSEIEGNTSHDSVETVYEIPLVSSKAISEVTLGDKLDDSPRVFQRSVSVDSCIGTESSGEAKNPATNASQSSNDTIEGLDPVLAPKELSELSLGSPASAPLIKTKLPPITTASKTVVLSRRLSSAKSQRSITPGSPRGIERVDSRRNNKTDAEAEDADGESETESEITDHFLLPTKIKHHTDGTDLELEEVDEDEGDDNDDRDAFDAMVANHLKYSRGLPTATSRRSKLNRGTQTTKSIEPSTTSGSLSPCSSSNSSFDVEIISKSKRITTTSSSVGGGGQNDQQEMITPSNMTLAWHEGGRRRSYLPSSSSSLNLLNMKFSLGKDFESEVSIRMPANKSSANNASSASMLLPGSGGTGGGRTLMSSSSRTHHHSLYQRGLSPSNSNTHNTQHSANHHHYPNHIPQSPAFSANPASATEPTELQSLWKDVRTKLDVQLDEMVSAIPEEEEDAGDLQVKGNGILPSEPLTTPGSGSTVVRLRRNEERIKRSLQRLKKILDD